MTRTKEAPLSVPDISNVYDVEVGQLFRPFEGSRDGYSFINDSFSFKGTFGQFRLTPQEKDSELKGMRTPLGPVKLVKTVLDGNLRTEQEPLLLGLTFVVGTLAEFDMLKNHPVEVAIGDWKYFFRGVSVDGNFGREEIQRSIIEIGDSIVECEIRSVTGTEVKGILLPLDPDKLRKIEARIIQRPQTQS